MATIGRPRHADVLTPAEWRVLELVQLGRSNPKIARSLGLSVNTVRFHVANILRKSGLPSRHELAGWRPPHSPAPAATAFSSAGPSLSTAIVELFRDARRHDPRYSEGVLPDVFTGRNIRPAQVIDRRRSTLVLASPLAPELERSERVALQGVAMDVAHVDGWEFTVRFPPDLRESTTLADLGPADLVNAERSVRLTERIAGYPITGLTDGIAMIRNASGRRFVVEIERHLRGLAMPNTPIAIDGVVCNIEAIHGTLLKLTWPTRVGFRPALGQQVNVEFDSLAHLALALLQKTVP